MPEPGASRYFVDTTITKLSAVPFGKGSRVNIECDVSVITATYPEHSMKMTASVGGCLDEPNNPKGITDAKNFCLDDAAKQAAEKVQTYLKGVRCGKSQSRAGHSTGHSVGSVISSSSMSSSSTTLVTWHWSVPPSR